MSRFGLAAIVAGTVLWLTAASSVAQVPIVTYYAPPTVTYVPEVRGLFGQRLVYRPVVSLPVAVAAPVAMMPAPAAPVTTYYAPTPAARVTTYYAPAPAVAPVTTYFAPAPAARVTTYYAPALSAASPAGVTTYYAPAAPAVGTAPRVTTYYAPPQVVTPPVTTYYPPVLVP